MDSVQLSIIIPYYNGREYIGRLIDSLSSIKCSHEILIVDDGSPDCSYQELKNQFANNRNIKVFKKENGGIADTRNWGLMRAAGQYILFADQDDYFDSAVINRAIQIAIDNKVDCVIWSTEKQYSSGELSKCDTVLTETLLSREEIRKVLVPQLLFGNQSEYVTYVGHIWAGLFKRKTIQEGNISIKHFFSYEDDILFVFDFLNHSNSVFLIKDTAYYWFQNEKSTSHTRGYVKGYFSGAKKYYDYCKSELTSYNYDDSLIRRYEVYTRQALTLYSIMNISKDENRDTCEASQIKDYIRSKETSMAFKEKNITGMQSHLHRLMFNAIRVKCIHIAFILPTLLYKKNVFKRNLYEQSVN